MRAESANCVHQNNEEGKRRIVKELQANDLQDYGDRIKASLSCKQLPREDALRLLLITYLKGIKDRIFGIT